MAQMIVDGLRPLVQTGRFAGPAPRDTDNEGDVEEEYSVPGVRKGRVPKRREPWENELSVSFILS